ncbi:Tape measure protein (TMP), partial [Durusdinium trenchii]
EHTPALNTGRPVPSHSHEIKAFFNANAADFLKGASAFIRGTQAIGNEASKVADRAGTALNRVGIAATGIAASAIRSFASFESTMQRAGAVTQTLGTRDFTRLEAEARRMGETTVYSAAQAAQAIEQMGLAGLSTTEIVGALPGALQLASAAQVSIAQASDVAAKTMRAYGAEAEDLTHINTVLVGTFTSANTNLVQLAEALKPVAPVAKAVGLSLTGTAAVIAKLSDAGFQGSIAGTALRNILSRLAGAVPEATSRLRELGIETRDSATGGMRDFFEILKDIEEQGLSESDILQVFGARGGPQMLALLEVGTEQLEEFAKQLDANGDIAQRISDANLSTLSGQFMLLRSAVESVQIELGKSLKPAVQDLFAFVQENREALVDAAAAFARFADDVIRFVIAHPRIAAGFAAFQTGVMLGLPALLIQCGRAMMAVSAVASAIAAVARATKGSGAALHGSLLTFTIAAIPFIALGVVKLANWFFGFNEAQKKSAELSKKLEERTDKATRELLREAQRLTGNDRRSFVAEELERAEKDRAGIKAAIKSQKKRLREVSTLYNTTLGTASLKAEQQALAELEAHLAAMDRRVEQLQTVLEGTPEETPAPQPATPATPPPAPAQPTDDRDAIEAAIRQATLGDASELATFIGNGATGEQLQQLLEAQGTDATTARRAADMVGDGAGTQEQVDQLALRIKQLIDDAERTAAAEAEQQLTIQQGLEQQRDTAAEITAAFDTLDSGTVADLRAQMREVFTSFKSGGLTAAEFADRMERLHAATTNAVEAAKAKEEREQRQRILAGDFSGLDRQQALEDRAFDYRMQQFNSEVDTAFRELTGAIEPASESIDGLGESLDGFGERLRLATGEDAQKALKGVLGFLGSSDGMRATILNQISLLQQSLRIASTTERRSELVEAIEALNAQLAGLDRGPTFQSIEGAFAPRDPGLRGGGTIDIELPITSITQDSLRMVTDALARV